MQAIEKKINQLSPVLVQELNDYLDYLISKKNKNQRRHLNQSWAGGLIDESYDSVDLQKAALKWRKK